MITDIKQIWTGGKVQKPLLELKAGRLSLYYEQGNLRYISDGRNEIIRMIYSALRDKEWLNINPVISSERVQKGSDNFRIRSEKEKSAYKSGQRFSAEVLHCHYVLLLYCHYLIYLPIK